MTVDLNELARQWAEGALTVNGVYTTKLPPGAYHGHTAAHPTPYAGLLFGLRGEARFEPDGAVYHLFPGRVLHVAKGMTLKLETGSDGLEYALIHYTLAGPEPDSGSCSRRHYVLETGEQPALAEMLRMLQHTGSMPGAMEALRMKELVYGIVHQMLVCARSLLNTETRTTVEHAIRYMQDHYMEPISLSTLAGLYGMDIKSFSYWFNKYAGIFPIDYLISHRMHRAKQMLMTGGGSIGDIAEAVGYADAHYFSRLFKKHTGLSPKAFRAQMGNDPPSF